LGVANGGVWQMVGGDFSLSVVATF
jgi:hypothetical protein